MSSNRPDQEDIPLTVAEFQRIAKLKLNKQTWDYYVSGADDEISLRRNNDAFQRLIIRPRILRNVSQISTLSNPLFGRRHRFPVAIAPSAMQKLVGGEGELDNVRAAVRCGTFMCLSSNATSTLEEVMDAAKSMKPIVVEGEEQTWNGPNLWFQIYISQDREKTGKLVKRAEAAGYEALVVTVDTPVLGNRINERKKALVLPSHLSLSNLDDPDPNKSAKPSLNRELLNAVNAEEAFRISKEASKRGLLNDSSLTWSETIPWLRRQTKLKIVVKGVMTSEDALLALQYGVDAIVVSNHGGRQLDSVSSTIEALPEVVAAVRGRVPVIVDGGITRGSDVFKALALGADFTLVGRPALWGLAYGGQTGVEMVLNILEREFSRTMALAGASCIDEISKDMLGVERRDGFGIAKL